MRERVSRDLEGRCVVVTGSTRGLGRAFVTGAAARGAAVVVNGRDAIACERLARELRDTGARALAVPGSVADEPVADRVVDDAVDAFGRVDLVVNNAGAVRDRSLVRMTTADFDDVIAVHLRGGWLVSRAAARVMRPAGHGSILNMVSGTALYGHAGQSNYAAAKGGLLALTRALSYELGPYGIAVNALSPVAATAMTEGAPGLLTAAPQMSEPDAIEPVVSYLATERGSGITGQVIGFDGEDLVIWTHPQPTTSATLASWALHDVHRFFTSNPSPLKTTYPDRWGSAARKALEARRVGGDPARAG